MNLFVAAKTHTQANKQTSIGQSSAVFTLLLSYCIFLVLIKFIEAEDYVNCILQGKLALFVGE